MGEEFILDLLPEALHQIPKRRRVDQVVDGRAAETKVEAFDETLIVLESEVVYVIGASNLGATWIGGISQRIADIWLCTTYIKARSCVGVAAWIDVNVIAGHSRRGLSYKENRYFTPFQE